MTAYKAIKNVENEEKKEYLNRYKKICINIDRLSKSISVLRCRAVNPTVYLDGMPKAKNSHDLSNYAALLDEKQREVAELEEEKENVRKEITARAGKLENGNENDVILFRYIDLLKWEYIADIMGYSVQHVHRIHSSALRNFTI